MAVTSGSRTNKWKLERETSPERTKVWTEPQPKTLRKVAVVYYLSRNGQLQQPHFMEVPQSSPEGLYLRDVINRLNLLRGKGMASMYSWTSKRSYKSGFVWHDLAENDFIYPAHGNEYVLKGSELLEPEIGPLITKSDDKFSSSFKKSPTKTEIVKSAGAASRRRNQSWAAADFAEYKVYASDRGAADASTQTEFRTQRAIVEREAEAETAETWAALDQVKHHTSKARPWAEKLTEEMEMEMEISPPPSDSSTETLETLMKSDPRVVLCAENDPKVEIDRPSGRFRASTVLMQLISCGSMSFKDCGSGVGRLPRNNLVRRGAGEDLVEPSLVKMEEKEYFSGSLVEIKKKEKVVSIGALKRSNSCNANRTSHMGLMEKETKRK